MVRGIEDLGYRRSCYDPCVFCLMGESGPQGHILVEVGATHGSVVDAENINYRKPSSSVSRREFTTVRVITPVEP